MKKTILILFVFISFYGYSQELNKLKVKTKLEVVETFELADSSAVGISSDGDTLATIPSVRAEIEDSLTNYVNRIELVDTLERYADTNFVQNQIHDSLSVFESSQWTDITGGISYDNNVTIGDTAKVSDISISGEIIPENTNLNSIPDYVITQDTTNKETTISGVSYVETVPMLDIVDTLELFTFDSLNITKVKTDTLSLNDSIIIATTEGDTLITTYEADKRYADISNLNDTVLFLGTTDYSGNYAKLSTAIDDFGFYMNNYNEDISISFTGDDDDVSFVIENFENGSFFDLNFDMNDPSESYFEINIDGTGTHFKLDTAKLVLNKGIRIGNSYDNTGGALRYDSSTGDFQGYSSEWNTLATEKGTLQIIKDTILYTNTSQTTIIALPANAIIWDIGINTTTAFNDTGTDLLDVGITSDCDIIVEDYDFLSTLDFTSLSSGNWYGFTDIPYEIGSATNITFTYTGENSDATAGVAYIFIHYFTF